MTWWPFVSRDLYDEVARDRAWWRQAALSAVPNLRILQPVAHTTRTGTTSPPVSPAIPTFRVDASWDDVSHAIAWRSAGRSDLRDHLATFAAEERAAGRTPAEVVSRIENWQYVPGTLPRERAETQESAHAEIIRMLDEDV